MTEFLIITAALGAAAGAIAIIVWLAERKGKAELVEKMRDEELRKLREAVEADIRARERFARGELLNDDGHKRD